MTTVLIVNDQALQRLGLRMFLEAQPDVVLLDLGRTDADLIQAIRRITQPDCHAKASRPDPAGGLPRGCSC